MRSSDRFRRPTQRGTAPVDLQERLGALTADELRALVRVAVNQLDDEPRHRVEELILRHASRSTAGWKPAAPHASTVTAAASFIEGARRTGYADPGAVDEHLRQGVTASLAGDHAAAHTIFETVFAGICSGDVDLGQDELVEEVLSVDTGECVRRFVVAAYVVAEGASRGAGPAGAPLTCGTRGGRRGTRAWRWLTRSLRPAESTRRRHRRRTPIDPPRGINYRGKGEMTPPDGQRVFWTARPRERGSFVAALRPGDSA